MGGSATNLATLGQAPSQPNLASSRSERDLSKVTKVRVRTGGGRDEEGIQHQARRGKMKTTTMILSGGDMVNATPSAMVAQLDVVRAPLDRSLADSTAHTLRRAAADLVQLYKRISLDHELEEGERTGLLRSLASAAGSAQSTLRPVVPAAVSVTDIGAGAGANGEQSAPQTSVSPSHGR